MQGVSRKILFAQTKRLSTIPEICSKSRKNLLGMFYKNSACRSISSGAMFTAKESSNESNHILNSISHIRFDSRAKFQRAQRRSYCECTCSQNGSLIGFSLEVSSEIEVNLAYCELVLALLLVSSFSFLKYDIFPLLHHTQTLKASHAMLKFHLILLHPLLTLHITHRLRSKKKLKKWHTNTPWRNWTS